MKRILLYSLFFIILCCPLFSQYIDNKVNFYFSYNTGQYSGNNNINKKGFIYPSLYSNYKNLSGYTIKSLFKGGQLFNLGLGIDYLSASGWKAPKYNYYSNSLNAQYSIAPIIQFHNKFTDTGFSNRVKVFFEIGPTIGLSELELSNQLIDIEGSSGIVSSQKKSTELFYAIKGNAGFELSLTRVIGVSLAYSFQPGWIRSDLYQDTQFSSALLNLGLFIKFKKDKLFFY
jgi:hypothetical protein